MLLAWFLSASAVFTVTARAAAGSVPVSSESLDELVERHTRRTEGGIHIPILRTRTSRPARDVQDVQGRDVGGGTGTGAIGLGDYFDV
jgi:hypothetical protein